MDPRQALQAAETVLVIDWPSRDVPEALALAGFTVVVRGGPEPGNFSAWEVSNGSVVTRGLGRSPERADLVYSYRPLNELPGIVADAKRLGAKAVWVQSGLSADGLKDARGCWAAAVHRSEARDIVQSAGLAWFDQPYIGDVAREIQASGSK